jgi:hypothetical protein
MNLLYTEAEVVTIPVHQLGGLVSRCEGPYSDNRIYNPEDLFPKASEI